MISNLNVIIASIHAYNSGIRIGICCTTPPCRTNDGFGNNYGNSLTRWLYKRANGLLARAIITAYGSMTGSGIYIVPLNCCLDTMNNMNTTIMAPNYRATNTVTRITNGVHPAHAGYQQIADQYYLFLKALA